MSLERVQASTNRQRVGAGNLSASNDPSQWVHDGREQLIKGAELAGAGRALGLSEEETLAAVSRQYRRQRRADDSVTPSDVLRQMTQSLATVKETAPEELRNVSTQLDLDTAFAQGEDIEYFNKYGRTRADDEQTYRSDDRGYMEDEDTGQIVRKPASIDRPMLEDTAPSTRTYRNRRTGQLFAGTTERPISLGYEGQNAPNSVMKEALRRVEAAQQQPSSLIEKVTSVFGGESDRKADLDTAAFALKRHLENERPQDARIGRATVRQDSTQLSEDEVNRKVARILSQEFSGNDTPGSAVRSMPIDARSKRKAELEAQFGGRRFDPEVKEANDYQAEAEAINERRRLYGPGGYGYRGDINLDRTAPIGAFGETAGGAEDIIVEMLAPGSIEGEIARRYDGVYLDPETGNTVALQGPESPGLPYRQDGGSSNTSADALNAPQSAREWLAQGLSERLEGFKNSDRIPQVDITEVTATTANKIRDYYKKIGLETTARVPENIRSVEELQRVINRVETATNGQLSIPDPERPGKQMDAGRRRAEGALQALGLTLGEQRQLSQALYQLDAAKRSSVNENPTGVYLSRTGEQVQGPAMAGSQTRRFGSDGAFTSDIQFDSATEMDKGIAKAPVAMVPKGSSIRIGTSEQGKPIKSKIRTQLAQLSNPDAQMPYIGQVADETPKPRRYTRTGESDPTNAAIAIRERARALQKGKEDPGRVRGNQVRAMVMTERKNRDERKRSEQRKLIQEFTPANLRQAGRYDEADQNISEIERTIREQRESRARRRRTR